VNFNVKNPDPSTFQTPTL